MFIKNFQRILFIFVILSVRVSCEENLLNKSFNDDVKGWSEKLIFYSDSYIAQNTLPIIFSRILHDESNAELSEHEREDYKEFKDAVFQYLEFMKFIKFASQKHLKDTILLLKTTSDIDVAAVLITILFSAEDVTLLPYIDDAVNRLGREAEANFSDIQVSQELIDLMACSGVGYDIGSFYTPHRLASLSSSFINSAWNIREGDSKRFRKKVSSYGENSIREIHFKFQRANILESGLPDRNKIAQIKNEIDKCSPLKRLFSFIVVCNAKDMYIADLNNVSISDRENSVFKCLMKLDDQKKNLLITPKECLYLFSQTPKEEFEKFMKSPKSIFSDPDLEPNCELTSFYAIAYKYIFEHRDLIWSEEEFLKLIANCDHNIQWLTKQLRK